MKKHRAHKKHFFKNYKVAIFIFSLSAALALSFFIFYKTFKKQSTPQAPLTSIQPTQKAAPPESIAGKLQLEPINIGTILDLSGSCAEFDSLILKAINLRIDEENA